MMAAAIDIMMRHPDRAHAGRTIPMTALPIPVAPPSPIAANPDEIRAGRYGDDFRHRWRRRLAYDDFPAGRGGLAINDAFAIDAASRNEGGGQNQQSHFAKE